MIVNNDAVTTGVQVAVWAHDLNSFGYIARIRMTGLYDIPMLTFWENTKCFPQPMGFPGSSDDKESACNVGNPG